MLFLPAQIPPSPRNFAVCRRSLAKWLAPALLGACLAPSLSQAATLTAASCGRADVASALSSANPGDTVRVPAGTCSWSGGLSYSGVQLVGAGSSTGGTVITSGLVTLSKNSGSITRLSGFRFTGTDAHIRAGGSSGGRPYVIDNNYIRADVSGQAVQLTANGGLLHHNQITAVDWTNADVFNTITSEDWSQAPTFGADDASGERNIYIEDNTFTNIAETAPDGDIGSRLVIRHNTYVDSSIVFHGGAPSDSSPNGGVRHFEVYGNTFVRSSNAFGMNKWIWVRGGTGVIANNTIARADSPDGSSYPNKPEIRLSLACPTSYPVQYQVGQSSASPQSSPTRPLLIFGNTGTGTADGNFISVNSSDTAGGSCGSPGSYIQKGRDYVLSNTWGWRPYTYPHPLAGGDSSGGSVLSAPQNLRVN